MRWLEDMLHRVARAHAGMLADRMGAELRAAAQVRPQPLPPKPAQVSVLLYDSRAKALVGFVGKVEPCHQTMFTIDHHTAATYDACHVEAPIGTTFAGVHGALSMSTGPNPLPLHDVTVCWLLPLVVTPGSRTEFYVGYNP